MQDLERIYKEGMHQNHETALQRVYTAGVADGAAQVKERAINGDPELLEEIKVGRAKLEEQKHEELAAKKRAAADADEPADDTHPAARRTKSTGRAREADTE